MKYLFPGFLLILFSQLASAESIHMANGIKIGEVNSSSAIIWTRLTKTADRNIDGKPFPKEKSRKDTLPKKNYDLEKMEGAALGVAGEVRVRYWPDGKKDAAQNTAWTAVDPEKDFTHQFQLRELNPGAVYRVVVDGRAQEKSEATTAVAGSFKTAPGREEIAPIRFAVVTCQDYPRRDDKLNGHKIYKEMLEEKLNFFVHAGDILYYDKPGPYAKTPALARFKWNRLYALPYLRNFHNNTSSYFIKDDHETVKNDSWPGASYGEITWEKGLAMFREQVPMGEKTYRTVRWGKDLQIWLVEGRDFRSANTDPDGPNKTIWGAEQKQWFYDTVKASDATFKVLISPTAIVGPDRDNKNDNHANAGFKHEGDEIRAFLGKQENMYVICGDRHWQYVSVDPVSGTREYSVGAASDAHAGGYSMQQKNDMHEYLKIKGGYFTVEVARNENVPSITLTHHGVDGSAYHEDVFKVKSGK